jgi:hypothetical protein
LAELNSSQYFRKNKNSVLNRKLVSIYSVSGLALDFA